MYVVNYKQFKREVSMSGLRMGRNVARYGLVNTQSFPRLAKVSASLTIFERNGVRSRAAEILRRNDDFLPCSEQLINNRLLLA
jgi:hypothetical protein